MENTASFIQNTTYLIKIESVKNRYAVHNNQKSYIKKDLTAYVFIKNVAKTACQKTTLNSEL